MTTSSRITFGRSRMMVSSIRAESCKPTGSYPSRSSSPCMSRTSEGESSTISTFFSTPQSPGDIREREVHASSQFEACSEFVSHELNGRKNKELQKAVGGYRL